MDVALSAVLTSLHRSCEGDNHYEVSRLFQHNSLIRQNLTIFSLPTFPSCPDCVAISLKYLPDTHITCKGALERNALIETIVLGEGTENIRRTVQVLSEYDDGLLVHESDALGRTALHYAVIRGDLELVKILAKQDPNFGVVDNDGNSVLHQFFLFNVKDPELLRFLLDEVPAVRDLVHLPNKASNTPAILALRQSSSDDFGLELLKRPSDKSPETALESIGYIVSTLQHIDQHDDLELLEKLTQRFGDAVFEGNSLLHLLADSGLTSSKALRYCLEHPGVLRSHVSARNSDNETPIQVAVKSKNRSLVQRLLDFEVNWRDLATSLALIEDFEIFFDVYERNRSILSFANDVNSCLGNLIEHEKTAILIKLNPDAGHRLENQMTFLHILAVSCKSEAMAEFFSDHELSSQVNEKDSSDRTPILSAMIFCNSLMYHRILDHFEPDLKVLCSGRNALHIAIRSEGIPVSFIVKLLIWDPDLKNIPNADGETPIMLALATRRFELVEYLLGLEVDLSLRSREANNALHYLGLYHVRDEKTLDLLLTSKEALRLSHERNQYQQTPVEIATAKENLELAAAFCRVEKTQTSNAQPKENGVAGRLKLHEKLDVIFEINNLNGLKLLLELTPPQLWKDESPLHVASRFPDVSPDILEFLIEHTEVNCQNANGDTPLHAAAQEGHLPLLLLLLSKANLFKKNHRQETALLAAINVEWDKINLDVIHIILKHAPLLAMIPTGITELVLESPSGRKSSVGKIAMVESGTPLELAIRRNLFDVVKMLVEIGGVDVNYVTSLEGNTILHHLANYQGQDERIMQFLLFTCKAFRVVNRKNKLGNTALHLAARFNNLKYARRLLGSKKIDVKQLNLRKETPLFMALAHNGKATSPELVSLLIQRHPGSVGISNHIGDLPVNLALNTGDPELVRIVVEEGKVNIDKWRDKHKNTLLHFIGLYNIRNSALCEYLISRAGSKVINEKNIVGQTILHSMCSDDHPALRKLLQHPKINVAVLNSNLDPPLMEYLQPDREYDEAILEALVKTTNLLAPNKSDECPLLRAILLYEAKNPVVVNPSQANSKKPLLAMLQHGSIDFTTPDKAGNGLFHMLARNVHNEEFIRLFLGKFMATPKADLNQQMERKNKEGHTPLDVARSFRNETFLDVVELS